jgi:DNA-binding transcriptional regulator GbsR (MarR family)
LRKKTYILDDTTLDMLDRLKCELNQKEVSVIKEAVRKLHEYHCTRQKTYETLNEIVEKLNYIVQRIEELSYKLGKCEERNRYLERKLSKMCGEEDV